LINIEVNFEVFHAYHLTINKNRKNMRTLVASHSKIIASPRSSYTSPQFLLIP